MSKITVTTIAGLTSGGDANTVKIESGDAFNVVSGATTLGGTASITGDVTISDDFKFTTGSSPTLGIGTLTPNRKLVVSGTNSTGAEISLTNTDMTADRRTMNWFMSGDKAHWRILNDAGNAGGTNVSLDFDGILDAGAFTGDYGTSFGILDSTSIGDSNIPYNSWGTPNNTYYRWVLPKAGTYLLSSNMRIRLWGVGGYIKARLYNNTTSTAIEGGNITGTTLGSQGNIRMLLEDGNNPNGHQFNVNITANYILTTNADNQDIHHQLQSNNNSTNTSMQSDGNGRNIHYWQRIG